MFEELMTDDAYILNKEGVKSGPYKTRFGSNNKLQFFDSKLEMDIEVDYQVIRPMSNGKEETYRIIDCDFQEKFHDIPPSYNLKIEKGTKVSAPKSKPQVQNITYNISDSQGFQAGNQNIQNITDSFNELMQQIESSDATPKEKEEAKGVLRQVLENPLVTAILGGALSGGVGMLG